MFTKDQIIKFTDESHKLITSGVDSYTATATPKLRAYVQGKPFFVVFTSGNTGAATLNIDGLGAKNIYKSFGTPLVAGDIQPNSLVELVYDGTIFQVIGGELLFLTINQRINSAAGNYNQTII